MWLSSSSKDPTCDSLRLMFFNSFFFFEQLETFGEGVSKALVCNPDDCNISIDLFSYCCLQKDSLSKHTNLTYIYVYTNNIHMLNIYTISHQIVTRKSMENVCISVITQCQNSLLHYALLHPKSLGCVNIFVKKKSTHWA